MKKNKNFCIGIIGLGYVGLPLALNFSKKFEVYGYDKSISRVNELKKNYDKNNEISKNDIKNSNIKITSNFNSLKACNFYIICVPTPLYKNSKKPDLSLLKDAVKKISNIIKKNDTIVIESTVYPGATEEIVPSILIKKNFRINKDFFLGYSPERINPGDKKNRLNNSIKICASNNRTALKRITLIYKSIIKNVFTLNNIKTAEMAKVIENIQRDINISFINEVALICNKLGISTDEVLRSASTKWNFINFRPGLVGGHCIGVDPYYLLEKCKKIKYFPKMINAGRDLNENMHKKIFNLGLNFFKKKIKKNISNLKILIVGASYKEEVNDLRNSGSEKLYNLSIKKYDTYVYDPMVQMKYGKKIYKNNFINKLGKRKYNIIFVLINHKKLNKNKILKSKLNDGIIFDFRNLFSKIKSNEFICKI